MVIFVVREKVLKSQGNMKVGTTKRDDENETNVSNSKFLLRNLPYFFKMATQPHVALCCVFIWKLDMFSSYFKMF